MVLGNGWYFWKLVSQILKWLKFYGQTERVLGCIVLPGQIGASVRMNARCYGGEVSQIVKHVVNIDHFGYLKLIQRLKFFKATN